MALIVCKECGQEMSENAKICPHCGNPNNLTKQEKREAVEQLNKDNTNSAVLAIIVTIVIIVGIILLIYALWDGLEGNELLESMGVEITNDSVILKDRDDEKFDEWKEDALNWLGFSRVYE